MTVFRPSFPPDNCTTMRTVSPLFSAARAEASIRNWGTAGARATSAVEENAPFRKLRRDVVMAAPMANRFRAPCAAAHRARTASPITSQLPTRSTRLRELKLRQRADRMDHLDDPGAAVGGPAVGASREAHQHLPRLGGRRHGQEQI